jgi:hypothetical protein
MTTINIGSSTTSPGITLGAGDTVTNDGTIEGTATGVIVGAPGFVVNSGHITGASAMASIWAQAASLPTAHREPLSATSPAYWTASGEPCPTPAASQARL